MKRTGKAVVFIVAVLTLLFAITATLGVCNYYGDIKTTYFKGAGDIYWDIDVTGGTLAVITPANGGEALTEDEMNSAKEVISNRLMIQGIYNAEASLDYANRQIVVKVSLDNGLTEAEIKTAIDRCVSTGVLKAVAGNKDPNGKVIISGADDISSASASYNETQLGVVTLQLTTAGKTNYEAGMKENLNGNISFYMDNDLVGVKEIKEATAATTIELTGFETLEDAEFFANMVLAGAHPAEMKTELYSTMSKTFGNKATTAFAIAGGAAVLFAAVLFIVLYRLNGVVSTIGLLGQVGGIFAIVTGYFSIFNMNSLSLAGMLGALLSVALAVDAYVTVNGKIKSELAGGKKTVEGAINKGYKDSWKGILTRNVVAIMIGLAVMVCFGVSEGFFAGLFSNVVGSAATSTLYSFGLTLFAGALWNIIMSLGVVRLMLSSLVSYKFFRNPKLFGGVKNVD